MYNDAETIEVVNGLKGYKNYIINNLEDSSYGRIYSSSIEVFLKKLVFWNWIKKLQQ